MMTYEQASQAIAKRTQTYNPLAHISYSEANDFRNNLKGITSRMISNQTDPTFLPFAILALEEAKEGLSGHYFTPEELEAIEAKYADEKAADPIKYILDVVDTLEMFLDGLTTRMELDDVYEADPQPETEPETIRSADEIGKAAGQRILRGETLADDINAAEAGNLAMKMTGIIDELGDVNDETPYLASAGDAEAAARIQPRLASSSGKLREALGKISGRYLTETEVADLMAGAAKTGGSPDQPETVIPALLIAALALRDIMIGLAMMIRCVK